MNYMSFLYEFSNKEINMNEDLPLLYKISLFGSLESKALLLFKMRKLNKFENYKNIIDILGSIVDNTDYNQKTEIIYNNLLNIFEDLISNIKIEPKTVEYYKILILCLKLVKILKNKSSITRIISKIVEKIELIDKEIFLRQILKELQLKITYSISSQTLNLILSNILEEESKFLENYLILFNNIKYPPYINNLTIENIIKLTEKLRNETNSLKIRTIIIDILYNYFKYQSIEKLISQFNKLENYLFLKYLFINRVVKEIDQDPILIHNSDLKRILSKLAIDKSSLIKVRIFSTESIPLHIRLNAFNTRKYSVNVINKYLKAK